MPELWTFILYHVYNALFLALVAMTGTCMLLVLSQQQIGEKRRLTFATLAVGGVGEEYRHLRNSSVGRSRYRAGV